MSPARSTASTRPFGLFFATVFSKRPPPSSPKWIIADRLPVRFQLQQHQYLWEPNARAGRGEITGTERR